MVDLSKVSQKIMEQVDAIKQMSGNSRKIDTPAEYESLSKLLAGEAGAGNKEYIQGFMIEYENKYPTLEKLEADKAQAELEKGLTEAGKKEIDDLLKQYDKSEKKFKPNNDIEMEFLLFYEDGVFLSTSFLYSFLSRKFIPLLLVHS